MKSISRMMLGMILSVGLTAPAQADPDLDKRLDRMERKIDKLLERNEQGDRDGRRLKVGVDSKCLKSSIENYKSYISKDVLLNFAKDCKGNIENRRCEEIGQSADNECFLTMTSAYRSVLTEDVMTSFRAACQAKIYLCE